MDRDSLLRRLNLIGDTIDPDVVEASGGMNPGTPPEDQVGGPQPQGLLASLGGGTPKTPLDIGPFNGWQNPGNQMLPSVGPQGIFSTKDILVPRPNIPHHVLQIPNVGPAGLVSEVVGHLPNILKVRGEEPPVHTPSPSEPKKLASTAPKLPKVEKTKDEEAAPTAEAKGEKPTLKTSALQENLEKAQGSRSFGKMMQSMLGAGNRIGAGLAGVKPLGDEAFKGVAEVGELAMQNLQEKIALEKKDPTSDYSKGLRDFLGRFGVQAPETFSAEMAEKVAPWALSQYNAQLARQTQRDIATQATESRKFIAHENALNRREREAERKLEADKRAEAKAGTDLDKRFSQASKLINAEVASSRSAFGRGANIYRSGEAIERLAEAMDHNNLDSRQITEIARNLDAMLSSGAATITGTKKLIPSTLGGDIAHIKEYIMGIPKGAQQGEFVKRMLDTVRREKELAGQQMKRTQKKLLGGYTDLQKKDPQRWAEMMRLNDLPADVLSEESVEESPSNKQASAPPAPPGKVFVTSPEFPQGGFIPEEKARDKEYMAKHRFKVGG